MPITIREMLEVGAHFGHQTRRWNPKMKPYIFGVRNGIHIINLEITARLWSQAYKAAVDTVARGEKVLFVGTKPQAQELVEEESKRAEQFYVNRRWLGGMLTNFKTIKSRIDRLFELEKLKEADPSTQRLTKKELVQLEKEREKLEKSLCGIRNMKTVPGLLVVVDPTQEHLAIKEAQKLQIPILAITDTNCDPDGIDMMIPANDDALKSIQLFLHDIAEACLEGSKGWEKKIQEETRKKADSPSREMAAATSPEVPVASRPPLRTQSLSSQAMAMIQDQTLGE